MSGGDAGVRHLSRRAGNAARGGSAPRRNLSLTVAVAGSPSPSSSVTFDGRMRGRSPSLVSDVAADTRATRLSCFGDFKQTRTRSDYLFTDEYWNTVKTFYQTIWIWIYFWWFVKWQFWIFWNIIKVKWTSKTGLQSDTKLDNEQNIAVKTDLKRGRARKSK